MLYYLWLQHWSSIYCQNESYFASNRMGNIGSMPITNLYPQNIPQIKPMLFEPQPVGNRLVNDWAHRNNIASFDRMSMGPILPMAVSLSVGYFLFRLLALGVFLLEKGSFFPLSLLTTLGLHSPLSELALPYGHWKMDTKFDATQFGRNTPSSSAELMERLTERVHRAFNKHEHVNKH